MKPLGIAVRRLSAVAFFLFGPQALPGGVYGTNRRSAEAAPHSASALADVGGGELYWDLKLFACRLGGAPTPRRTGRPP